MRRDNWHISVCNGKINPLYILMRNGVTIPFERVERHIINDFRWEWHFIRHNYFIDNGEYVQQKGEIIVARIDNRSIIKGDLSEHKELCDPGTNDTTTANRRSYKILRDFA